MSTASNFTATDQHGQLHQLAKALSVDELRWWLLEQCRQRSAPAELRPAPTCEPAWLRRAATDVGLTAAAVAGSKPVAQRAIVGGAAAPTRACATQTPTRHRARRSQRLRPRGCRAGARHHRQQPNTATNVQGSDAAFSADSALAIFLARARKVGVRVSCDSCLNPLAKPFVPRSRLLPCFDELMLRTVGCFRLSMSCHMSDDI